MATARSYEEIPKREGIPVLGNAHQFFNEGLSFYENCEPLGDVVSFSLMNSPALVVANPELAKQVLVEKNEKFGKGQFIRDNFGHAAEGVFVVDGETWEQRRSLLQPSFRPNHIKKYSEQIVDVVDRMGDRIERQSGPVELDYVMNDLALSVLTSTLFGVEEDHEMKERIHRAVEDIQLRFGASYNTLLPPWVPTLRNLKYRRSLSDLHDIIDRLIERRLADDGEGPDLLSVLLEAREENDHVTDEVIRDELLTFTLAGHDTTSLAMTYTWHLLATHPEKMEKLLDEFDDVLGGDPASFRDFSELEYLEQVIQEALRLFPPITQLFRETETDVQLGEYHVPEGVTVTLPQWSIHRDERYYDNPETFRPERWADDLADEIPEYAHFPFGGGPRHCIGMRFAMMEMKIAISMLAQRFRFEPAYESLPEVDIALTLQPEDAVEMHVEPK
ncbi:cytochrome P450 [Halorussus ruber]|uniref:cytochrome P450 n=1 Tax=Halorussus ruber TaxID=1126238 RepID=UPI001091E787|nr:cytochrome P450 [Halorussus ruber]